MAIVPYNNKNNLMTRPFSNMINDFFGDSWKDMQHFVNNTFKLDVREEILHYIVEAEMPGVSKDNIDIDFHDGRLSIRVTERDESEEDKNKVVHRERCYSSMQRSVYLDDAKAEGITAALTEGVLRITVPKTAHSKEKSTIEIE